MKKIFAQYGGTGGQTNPFAPGSSPLFRGGPSGYSGYGIDDFSRDLGLDMLMSRTHKSNYLGSEKPLETLLEIFHESLEKDIAPYLLTFEERQKLNTKKKIRQKEQYLKDLSKEKGLKEKENTVLNKLHTVENLLSSYRKNENKDFGKFASYATDDAGLENSLSREHTNEGSFTRTRSTPSLTDEALTPSDEFNNNELAKARLSYPFSGQDFHYDPSDGPDKYWNFEMRGVKDGDSLSSFPNQHDQFEPSLLMNFPNPAENKTHTAPNTFKDLSSYITEESKTNNKALEDKLNLLKKKHNPKTLETELGKIDLNESTRGRYPERNLTTETGYPTDGFGTPQNVELVGPGPAGAGVYPLAGYL